MRAILDTGAEKNVITADLLKYFKRERTQNRNLIVAGGRRIPILGNTKFSLTIGGLTVDCRANVIESLPLPLLLGMEFLKAYESIINLREGTVTLTVGGRPSKIFLNNVRTLKHGCQQNNVITTRISDSEGKTIPYIQKKKTSEKRSEIKKYGLETHHGKEREMEKCSSAPRKQFDEKMVKTKENVHLRGKGVKRRSEEEKETMRAFNDFLKSERDYEGEISKAKIEEKTQDLFENTKDFSLAHCVSADMTMGKGIAKTFRRKFGGKLELLRQKQKPGGLAVLNRSDQFIFYLITKQHFWEKPSLKSLWMSLNKMKKFILENKIQKVAMPRIGCGFDQLDWKLVKNMIWCIFNDVNIDILICNWPKREENCLHISDAPIVHKELQNPQTDSGEQGHNYGSLRKVVLKEDSILVPGGVYDLKVEVLGDQMMEPDEWTFLENDIFYYSKGLIRLNSPVPSNMYIRVENKNHRKIKVLRGSSVGYFILPESDLIDESIVLYMEETEDTVTAEDHQLDHLVDSGGREQLANLLQEYRDVFSKSTRNMGLTTLTKHKIDVGDAAPIKCRPYRVSQKERQLIDEQIREMLESNVIRPCHSPWASPVVLVKKKDGSTRFCVDYRKLNNVTRKSTYPIPNIDDILTYLGDSKYFTTLDMFSGYWQVEIEEESKQYTAFIAQGHGLYEFNVLSFGLCNAPATFQHLADQVFDGMKWRDVLIYLDDIVVFSRTWEEHLEKLERVFKRLREAGLTLKPSKCIYAKPEVKLLGHVVSKEGIAPDEEKLRAIRDFPEPKTIKHVQSFVGLCNYYRKFIKNFSIIARPLHMAIKKETGFVWGFEQRKSFEVLKKKLTTAPVLQHFNPNKGCELRVDACTVGIGAILLQEGEDGHPHPVAYVSRSLSNAEKNYTITELEGLAAIWSLGYLRHLIYGRPVKIVSDHHALCWIRSLKDPTGRLARWSLRLSEFDYTIVHKNGAAHADADCLSRNPVLAAAGNMENVDDIDDIPTFILLPEDIAKEQQADPSLKMLIAAFQNPQDVPIGVAKRAKNFRFVDGVLYKVNPLPEGPDNLLVIPAHLREEILYSHHSEPLAGHLGLTKTLFKIKERYFWESLQKDVERFVRGCEDCQARKGQQNKKPVGLLQPIEVGTPFERVGIDLLGPFRRSRSGKTMIIVATDYATRWVETEALSSGQAKPVAKFILEKIITRHGSPRYILSDQGKTFRSNLVRELLKCMGTCNQYTTAYHPSCNGLTERFNKTLANMLSMYTNEQQTDWDEYLSLVTFAYNTARQDTTQFSPFMLVYGREAIQPTEANLHEVCKSPDACAIRERALAVRSLAVENIKKKQGKDKKRYDSKHRYLEFKKGDQVKVFTPVRKVGRSEKLLLRWFGPYYIVEKKSQVDYLVQKGPTSRSKSEVVHVSRILPYHDPWTPVPVPKEDGNE